MGQPQGKPGGGNNSAGNITGGTTGTFQPGQNFWEYNPRNIANANPMQQQAASAMGRLPGLGAANLNNAQSYLQQLAGGGSGMFGQAIQEAGRGTTNPAGFGQANNLLEQLYGTSRRKITGENLAKDPAILAAQERFKTARLPMLQNMAAQAGLGRSNTVSNAASLAQSNELLPLMMEGMAREERGIGREMGALTQGISTAMGQGSSDRASQMAQQQNLIRTLMGAGAQEASNLANSAQGLAGIQAQQFGQGMQATGQAFDMGGQLRDIEQQQSDAGYDEQQRLFAEALNSIYGPLGMIGGLVGGTATSSQGKK